MGITRGPRIAEVRPASVAPSQAVAVEASAGTAEPAPIAAPEQVAARENVPPDPPAPREAWERGSPHPLGSSEIAGIGPIVIENSGKGDVITIRVQSELDVQKLEHSAAGRGRGARLFRAPMAGGMVTVLVAYEQGQEAEAETPPPDAGAMTAVPQETASVGNDEMEDSES